MKIGCPQESTGTSKVETELDALRHGIKSLYKVDFGHEAKWPVSLARLGIAEG